MEWPNGAWKVQRKIEYGTLSVFWHLSRLEANGFLDYEKITLDMCTYGRDKPQPTTLVSRLIDFSTFAQQCDG